MSRLGADAAAAVRQVSLTDARARLGKLVEEAAGGAPCVLARSGVAVAVIVADTESCAPAAVPSGRDPSTVARQEGRRTLYRLGEVLQSPPPSARLAFGLPVLDEAVSAMSAGRLVLVAGRPGAGGSLLAVAAARTAALTQGRPVLYAASGLTRLDVAARMVAAEAGVNYQQYRANTLPPAQQAAAREIQARIEQEAPLYIDDGSDLTAQDVADSASYLDGAALVVVDRLAHEPTPHLPLSGDALPQAARILSGAAARLNVPVLAVVDSDDPALLARLGADITLSVVRDGATAEVRVAERDLGGPLSVVRLYADLACARFTDPAAPPAALLPPRAPAEGPGQHPASCAAGPGHETAPPAASAVPHGQDAEDPARTEIPPSPDSDSGRQQSGSPPAAADAARVERGEQVPCEGCGGPTPYRIGGRPMHLKGFCRPVPVQIPAQEPPPETAADAPPAPEPAPEPAPPVRQVTDAAAGAWPAGASRPQHAAGSGDVAGAAEAGWEEDEEDTGGFDWGPFAVLDGEGVAHLGGGSTMPCPATTVRDLVTWVADRPIGSPRLTAHGRDGDPLVVLMPEAAERLGLPATDDPRHRALPADHPVLADLAAHGWEVPVRGGRPWFSAWVRIFQRVERGRRSVQLAILSWGALAPSLGWPLPVDDNRRPLSTTAQVVAFLTAYAQRVMTPVSSTAATGQELMTALRPPTRPWREPGATKTSSAWVEGSLHVAVDPAPCEVPREHPLARGRNHLDPAQTLMEEALQWWRTPTEAERHLPHVVAFDVNAAFGAAANSLRVGTSACYHLQQAAFDPKLPGSWLHDLSGIAFDDLLPSPFTPDGRRPTGPGWYETRTIAYAVEHGFLPPPAQAYVRPNETQAAALGITPQHLPVPTDARGRPKMPPPPPFGNGPYLKAWYEHLRDAYLDTYAQLGITPGMEPRAFMDAMARLGEDDFRTRHATDLLVLAAIKSTFKGGIGKLRERPHDTGRRGNPHAPWKALERPTWRPDIRAAVISRSRVNLHRKIAATARATEQLTGTAAYPLAVATDCVMYASADPDVLWLTGHQGGFQLGVSPGHVKGEPTHSMDWYLTWAAKNVNPARKVKDGYDAVFDGGE
ncbi:hypothetical protein BEN35_18955 [Streptomyces fradiae]|nr:hypothetical protein BEN35_18955 [Streptomyces fradiae]